MFDSCHIFQMEAICRDLSFVLEVVILGLILLRETYILQRESLIKALLPEILNFYLIMGMDKALPQVTHLHLQQPSLNGIKLQTIHTTPKLCWFICTADHNSLEGLISIAKSPFGWFVRLLNLHQEPKGKRKWNWRFNSYFISN